MLWHSCSVITQKTTTASKVSHNIARLAQNKTTIVNKTMIHNLYKHEVYYIHIYDVSTPTCYQWYPISISPALIRTDCHNWPQDVTLLWHRTHSFMVTPMRARTNVTASQTASWHTVVVLVVALGSITLIIIPQRQTRDYLHINLRKHSTFTSHTDTHTHRVVYNYIYFYTYN